MEKNINYEMCKKCGGACCKESGCVYNISDFESMDYSYLKNEIDKGKISISGQPVLLTSSAFTYLPYLRARNVGAGEVDLITKGGPCINLTETGCSLSEDDRPGFGLMLKPTKIGESCDRCESDLSWLYYNDVLEQLVKYYYGCKNRDIIDIVVDEISKQIVDLKKKDEDGIPFTSAEKQILYWYYKVMANNQYFTPNEVTKMILL